MITGHDVAVAIDNYARACTLGYIVLNPRVSADLFGLYLNDSVFVHRNDFFDWSSCAIGFS